MRIRDIVCVASLLAATAAPATAAVFADNATTVDVTPFGSGILTGAPDLGGAFLSDTFDPPNRSGSIVWGFSAGLQTVPGIDLRLYELSNSIGELYELALSGDGVLFDVIGTFDTTVLTFDLDAFGFSDPFSFVRVRNAGTFFSPDFDAAEGFHVAPIPLPAALPLMLAALAGLATLRRRRS